MSTTQPIEDICRASLAGYHLGLLLPPNGKVGYTVERMVKEYVNEELAAACRIGLEAGRKEAQTASNCITLDATQNASLQKALNACSTQDTQALVAETRAARDEMAKAGLLCTQIDDLIHVHSVAGTIRKLAREARVLKAVIMLLRKRGNKRQKYVVLTEAEEIMLEAHYNAIVGVTNKTELPL